MASKTEAKQQNTVIENTQKCGIGLPPNKEGQVLIIQDSADSGYRNLLIPGDNEIETAYWNEIKNNPMVQIWLKTGDIRDKGLGTAQQINLDWAHISESRLQNVLENLDDLEKINDIRNQVKSQSMRKLCDLRAKTIVDEANRG